MPGAHDVRDRVEKIDEEIHRLLEDRRALCEEAWEEDPEFIGAEFEADVRSQWEAYADEREWKMGAAMRICGGIVDLCRKSE